MHEKIMEAHGTGARLSGTVYGVSKTEMGMRVNVLLGDYQVFIFPDCDGIYPEVNQLIGSNVSFTIASYDPQYHMALGVLKEPA